MIPEMSGAPSILESLVAIPSITGNERAVVDFVEQRLRSGGWTCESIPVSEGRRNLFAHRGDPRVVLSTHADTVPPHVPPRREGRTLFGRGSCDAKGSLAAMLDALETLLFQVYGRQLEREHRIIVDAEGFRQTRKSELHAMARFAADQVRKNGRSFTFGVLNSTERRIIHTTLSAESDLITESVGDGRDRRLQVRLPTQRDLHGRSFRACRGDPTPAGPRMPLVSPAAGR